MPVSVDVSKLPAPVAVILRPWGGVLETARVGMGETVRATAEAASAGLWRRVVMLPPIERELARALSASAELALALNARPPEPAAARGSAVRVRAVRAFEGLILRLGEARPNARAKGLGLGW